MARVCQAALQKLQQREMGIASTREVPGSVTHSRASNLELSSTKLIETSKSGGGILWADVDPVEHRYLLSSSVNCMVAIHDIQMPSSRRGAVEQHKPLAVSKGNPRGRENASGHKFSVSCCCWYPVDTGMFVTSSFDHTVKMWDTNCMQPACEWDAACKVYNVSMSPMVSTHCLVAAACDDHLVRLCDPQSGGMAHTLNGHKDSVWAVAWSASNDWQVFTGGKDGRLLAWDIRRAGVMWVLDEQRTRPLTRGPRKMHHLASMQSRAAPGGSAPHCQPQRGKKARRKRTHMESAARDREELGLNLDGLMSVKAVAHSGAITCLAASSDSLHLMSAGTDSRLRLWDTSTGDHLLVHYPDTFNRASKPRRFCFGADGRVTYHPSGSVVQVFDSLTGQQQGKLRGHFGSVNCCVWNSLDGELFTGSADGNILVWNTPKEAVSLDLGQRRQHEPVETNLAREDEDSWSD